MSFEDEVRALSKLVERLALRYPDVPRESIESAVHEEHHALDGRPVRAYVPLLVERSTKTRLRKFGQDTAGQAVGAGPLGPVGFAGVEPVTEQVGNDPSGLPPMAGDPIRPIT